MAEVAVAVLDVDEGESCVACHPRRLDEPIDEPVQVLVRHQRHAGRETPIQEWMCVGRAWLGTLVHVGLRVAPGVRELKPDEEIVGCVAAESFPVRRDERVAEPRNRGLRLRGERDLSRICAAVVLNGPCSRDGRARRPFHSKVCRRMALPDTIGT